MKNSIRIVEYDSDRSSNGSFEIELIAGGFYFSGEHTSFDTSNARHRDLALAGIRKTAKTIAKVLHLPVKEDLL